MLKIQKRALFLWACVYACGNVVAQPPVKSMVVSGGIPDRAVRLSNAQAEAIITKEGYKHSQVTLDDKRNLYQIDGLLVSCWDVPISPDDKRSLEQMRIEGRAILNLNKDNIVNFSNIETINNVRFLITEYERGDEVFLRFISEARNNNHNLNGIVQFKKPDEEKAQIVLKELLQGIRFK